MWYNRGYIAWLTGEISVVWVCFLLLVPPPDEIRKPNCTASLNSVGVVIIKIWITIPLVLLWFSRWMQIETGSCQSKRSTATFSGGHFSHMFRCYVFFILPGQIIQIRSRLTGSRSCCRGEEIDPWHFLGLLTDNGLCLAQYSFSTYFRHTTWCWAV